MAENDIEALAAARRIVADYYFNIRDPDYAGWVLKGEKDNTPHMQIALTALRSTTAEPFSRPTDPSEAVWDEWTSHPTDSAAKDAEIAAYREALEEIDASVSHGKLGDWSLALSDIRKFARHALANRGEAGA